ncbi:MAG TPA: ATP-binding cassette domain-containing protein [Micromonosporaceae bacterium]|jgi:ABC-2 type transport system ATP-binding protein|nr:ATP-binding cassette domain-containing protein [Micromonosporaceae bacterium]
MTNEPAIAIDGLTKAFGTRTVLGGVDLAVERGTIHALLGPNGAGKTTLVRILATLTRPDAGIALVDGRDVVRDRHHVRRVISLTGQYAAVDDLQTGEENLRMMARLGGLSRSHAQSRVRRLLGQFDLTDVSRQRVATYSGGMRRRLDLAASLIGAPAVVFLDEPSTGLDLPSRQAMWQVIRSLAGSGVTVLLTTQYLEEADQLADRIAVLDGGRIIADGTASELKARVAEQRLDITARDGTAYQQIRDRLGERAALADPARRVVGVATDGSAAHVRVLLDDIDPERIAVSRFAIHTATLDDVFLALTGHAPATIPDDLRSHPASRADLDTKESAHV